MQKDWVGNKNSVFKNLSANSHCNHEYEENSFYATATGLPALLNKYSYPPLSPGKCAIR